MKKNGILARVMDEEKNLLEFISKNAKPYGPEKDD